MSMSQIPNIITSIRFVLAAIFPAISEDLQITVISLALITEFLDGVIARQFNWASELGQVLDPIADKVFFGSVCSTWLFAGKVSGTEFALLGASVFGNSNRTIGTK